MRGFPHAAKAFLAGLLALFMLAGCTRPLAQPQTPSEDGAAPALTGSILFAERQTQADMREVATSATVSLIDAATNVTIASSLTNDEGSFSLKFGSTFRPSRTAAYFLEAVKGLSSGGDSNRAGAALARVRTLIYWRSGTWKSLSRQGIIVNRSTTALSIITNLRNAAGQPVNTEGMINSVNVGFPDSSLSPTTADTFQPGASQIGNDEFHQVFGLVEDALERDVDPVFAVSMDMGPPRRYLRSEQGFTVQSVAPTTGKSHDTVTITGYAFDPLPSNNNVTFNGWKGEVLTVSGDRTLLTVKVPRRLGLSGPIAVQVGGLLKTGPVWTQNGWQAPFDDADDFKDLLNAASSGGSLVQQSVGSGFTDNSAANFNAGSFNGLARRVADPVDGGDGAVDLGITALRVLQVFPDGHNQLVTAQGAYNWRPDLFDFEILPISVYNTLVTLDDAFNASQITKTGITPPASASLGGTIARKLRDYDILFFGVADGYAGKDLTANSRDLTRSFAQLGRGVLFSHDTIAGPSWVNHPNFVTLSDVHGLAVHDHTLPGNNSVSASTVYQVPGVNLTSSILTRPFDLSGVANFAIKSSHSLNQNTSLGATAWYAYDVSSPARANVSPYWTSYTTATSNSAFFSYGHTQQVPSEHEAKAMINSMYYTFDRGTTVSGSFTSRALDSGIVGNNWAGTPLGWSTRTPTVNTQITFQVAATNDPAATALTYVGPDGTAATQFTKPGTKLPALTGQYLRYRATLSTNSIASVPLLSRVDIGAAFAAATSVAIAPNAITAWGSLTFITPSPAGSARLQVLDLNGNPLPDSAVPNNSEGLATSPVSLAGLSAITYPSLRVRTVFHRIGAPVPKIDHLQVTWTP